MKHILLIGGAGYIGSVITAHFLKNGYRISVLDNLIYNNHFALHPYVGDPDYNFIYGDINNTHDLEKASQGITDVILLAGLVGEPVTSKYPGESNKINNTGIKKCINFFNGRGIDKLIFISTCSNYGKIPEEELADEDYQLKPLSLYAKDKVNNELYLLDKKEKVDYTGVVLRFGTAFGLSPRMRFDLTINEFARILTLNQELLVFDEYTWRPYCHVRDFARLLDIVIKADPALVNFEVFNVGGDKNNFTKKMIVEEILKYIPTGKVKYGSNGNDPRNFRVSFSKVKQTLGFTPKYTVPEGIEELIQSFNIGLYGDYMINKNKYGNFEIKY
ncbi:MAG: NAD-dependent epimerase/dehydratase family protein [Bacteroidota bacterium]